MERRILAARPCDACRWLFGAASGTGKKLHGVYRHHTFCCVQGLKLHAAFKLSFILAVLQKHGLVSPAVAESVTSFIAANQTFGGSSTPAAAPAAAATPAKPSRYSFGRFSAHTAAGAAGFACTA